MTNYWTEAEIYWLYTGLSDKEIAEKIGRSVKAIRKKRYEITGHYVEIERQRDNNPEPKRFEYSRIYKEARILSFAKKLGVKLYG